VAQGTFAEDVVLAPPDGERFPVRLRGRVIRDAGQEVVGVAYFYTDITRQRQLEAQLKRLSHVDGLTGVQNRRAFDENLTQEWARARRESAPLSLILIDIDAFRLYNDHYGHQAGDECLKKIAGVIAETFKRPGDYVARYGGEEFAIIVADSDGEGVASHAERLRTRVEYMAIPHEKSLASNVVTISLGLSTQRPDGTNNPSGMVESADRALYRAKETGRNRLCQELPSTAGSGWL
jgi:diguanylate cyclase (GGDEF)-like protein